LHERGTLDAGMGLVGPMSCQDVQLLASLLGDLNAFLQGEHKQNYTHKAEQCHPTQFPLHNSTSAAVRYCGDNVNNAGDASGSMQSTAHSTRALYWCNRNIKAGIARRSAS
jgi:hypothetical protein